MICKYFSGVALAALTLAAPVFAETVAITGGTVWTGTQDAPIENGVVLIVDGSGEREFNIRGTRICS